MTIVSTATEDGHGPKKPGIQIVRVADVARTASQANILLGVAASAQQLLITQHEIGARFEVDPESANIARKTYEMAHVRLRDLIDDQSRWDAHDDLRPAFDSLHAAQKRALTSEAELDDARKSLVRESQRPCFSLGARVKVFVLPSGRTVWVAFLGQVPESNGLVGEGSTPAEAFDAFDRAYASQAEVQPVESPPSPPEPPAPVRRRKPKK